MSQRLGIYNHPVRVYIEDTDAGGIVYYVNYLKYFERARTEWLRAIGVEFAELAAQDSAFVVAHAEIHYRASAFMDDDLNVQVEVEKHGKASILFRQTIWRGLEPEPQLICEGRVKVGCISMQKRTPKAIPEPVIRALANGVDINTQKHS